MPLEIKIVSEHADLVGDDCVREFHDDGGTIGRSLLNDWILPDPDRYISGRHAAIDFKGGIYYLIDTSSNGVYINDELKAVGKGNPRRLFDGDKLRMGDFLFEVVIDSGESLMVPLEEVASGMPVSDEQFVDEVSMRTGIKLLDEEEITGDEEFQSAMFGKTTRKMDPPPAADPELEIEDDVDATEDQLEESKPASVEVTAEDLFDSFLDGLGISRIELDATVSRPEMLMNAGQMLREFVQGSTDLLSSRADLKNTFKLDQTSILPRQNNPLKFSVDTTELLKTLLVGGKPDQLSAAGAVQEVCKDLRYHQDAFLDAMNSAFIDFADRFDPAELQQEFDRTLGDGMLSFLNKNRYWNMFSELYPIMTEKGGSRFPRMFGEEFVAAYERQVAEFQRLDRESLKESGAHVAPDTTVEPGLLATQKIDRTELPNESAFIEDDVTEVFADGDVLDIDSNIIDELENAINSDQLQQREA